MGRPDTDYKDDIDLDVFENDEWMNEDELQDYLEDIEELERGL